MLYDLVSLQYDDVYPNVFCKNNEISLFFEANILSDYLDAQFKTLFLKFPNFKVFDWLIKVFEIDDLRKSGL